MTSTGVYVFPSQVPLTTTLREQCLNANSMKLLLDLASDTLSMDFRRILRDGTEEEANDPRFRRPLINLMGIAGFNEEQRRRDLQPVCVTGVSLGYLSAATAAGWISLEDMVRMSNLQASIEIDVFGGTDYKSVFFFNCDPRRVLDDLAEEGLGSLLHLSGFVSSNQFLAGCRESDLPRLQPVLARSGALFRAIPNSYPGHCDLMGEVKERFAKEWRFLGPSSNTSIPIVSITDGRPQTNADSLWEVAVEQYTTILDWHGILKYLESLELDTYIILEPSGFLLKSMSLDPSYSMSALAGGVGHGT